MFNYESGQKRGGKDDKQRVDRGTEVQDSIGGIKKQDTSGKSVREV